VPPSGLQPRADVVAGHAPTSACRARRAWRKRLGMLKQPSFAAAVNREELQQGVAALGEDFDEHIEGKKGSVEWRRGGRSHTIGR